MLASDRFNNGKRSEASLPIALHSAAAPGRNPKRTESADSDVGKDPGPARLSSSAPAVVQASIPALRSVRRATHGLTMTGKLAPP